MKSVLIRLQEYESQAREAEKNVIRIILDDPDTVVKCSIHELAQKAFHWKTARFWLFLKIVCRNVEFLPMKRLDLTAMRKRR